MKSDSHVGWTTRIVATTLALLSFAAVQASASDCGLPVSCSWLCPYIPHSKAPAAIRDTLPAGGDLVSFLHQYRDQVMSQSPLGRRYVTLYYTHGKELSTLINGQPVIRQSVTDMLVRIVPNIGKLIEGNQAELTAEDRRAAMDLIERFHVLASPELRTALVEVRGDLAAGRLDSMLSDELSKAGTLMAASALRWTGIGLILSAGLMAVLWCRRSALAA